MALEDYKKKRHFTKTPEPGPYVAATDEKALRYVIQKHASSRLHYDLRLEMHGVLASWAVPKGPSLDPDDKRLAVHVEDHPVEYGSFEGVIPAGEYGAGTVMLWDQGWWRPHHDIDQMMDKGHLSFTLEGAKLRGAWNLVLMRGGRFASDGDKDNWLLIKERDEEARPGDRTPVEVESPDSAATGRTIEQIAAGQDPVWHTDPPAAESAVPMSSGAREPLPSGARGTLPPGARQAGMPRWIRPELCTLVVKPPEGADWLHEIKFDGYRMMCRIEDGRAAMLSRNDKDWTDRLAPISAAAAALPVRQAILDGEVVTVRPDGVSDFSALKEALGAGGTGMLLYEVFDLLFLDGHDLLSVPLLSRKKLLAGLLGGPAAKTGPLRYTDHVVGDGDAFYGQACRIGLEGVVSKRADSAYRPGERGREWLKAKCTMEQEFVIVGFTEPEGSRAGFGALVIGYHDDTGALRYAGRVGTGFDERTLAELRASMARLAIPESAVTDAPRGAAVRGVTWIEPELVAEVRFTEWTPDGHLRHPAFRGLREDKMPREVVREKVTREQGGPPKGRRGHALEIEGISLTHADKVLYPEQGITKRQLAEYFQRVGDWMLPHLAGRPLTLVRCPEGREGQCFFQKHIDQAYPDQIRRVQIQEQHKVDVYAVADSLAAIIGLVQMGVLEIHTWGSRADKPDRPDRLIFDLDPAPDTTWADLSGAARLMKARLEALGLVPFLKTTGGKGLHVVAPIARTGGWAETEAFARAIVEDIARQAPDLYTANMSKKKRAGKIFIDYLRNARGATAIAAFSARARPGAPVSVPVAWDELDEDLRGERFTIANVHTRLQKMGRPGGGKDPWAAYATSARRVTKDMRSRVGRV